MSKNRNLFLCSVTAAIFLGVDQGSKFLVQSRGVYVEINRGISFGLLNGFPLIFVLSIFLLVLAIAGYHSIGRQFPIEWGVLIGSATSNLVDRIIFGGVRDWLPIPFLHLNNNIADWGITLSLIWISVQLWHARDSNTV
ncbi:MAG: hypothetical protein UX35_C0001G0046 [Microgenomates group bacterium GW2011_GWA1_46_15]|nr:MAG: hypothetical protein UX00_C0003G0045 [Microgenomates group bacterium GW2011_GWB1_45_17]KKU24149.1 MAG: hypothetical protein UX36_C0002G0132 [Microgenomates group bacterium GW2011_GWC1_46_15]KKU24864.1 MAG: hypothetical protein UX35_C0001G0046 [Microgenomates group bacterium GW2011_GWA1_46_15]